MGAEKEYCDAHLAFKGKINRLCKLEDEVHDRVWPEISKRPKTITIWTVVGIFLISICSILIFAFGNVGDKMDKVVESNKKVELLVYENTTQLKVMQKDLEVWKINAPPYHTHHPDGRITKP